MFFKNDLEHFVLARIVSHLPWAHALTDNLIASCSRSASSMASSTVRTNVRQYRLHACTNICILFIYSSTVLLKYDSSVLDSVGVVLVVDHVVFLVGGIRNSK